MMPALGMIAVTAAVDRRSHTSNSELADRHGCFPLRCSQCPPCCCGEHCVAADRGGSGDHGWAAPRGTSRQQVAYTWARRRQARNCSRRAARRSLTGRRVLGTAHGTHDWCRVRIHLPADDEASGVPAWPSDLASIRLDSVRIRSHGLEWGVGAVIAIATDRLLPTFGCAPAHRREELS